MITKTQWRPSTCKCILNFTLDDGVLVSNETVERCKEHTGIIDDKELYYEVLSENNAMTAIVTAVKESIPNLHKRRKEKARYEEADENGQIITVVEYDDYETKVPITFSYNVGRVVEVDIGIDDAALKLAIKQNLETKASAKSFTKPEHLTAQDKTSNENAIAQKISEVIIL